MYYMDEQYVSTDLSLSLVTIILLFLFEYKKRQIMYKIHIIYINEQISKSLRMFSLPIKDTIYMIDEQIVVIREKKE